MGKTFRCGIVRIILSVLLIAFQWHIIRANPSLSDTLTQSPIGGFSAIAVLFWPAMTAAVLAVSGIKDLFTPHPLIKSREEIIYKSCTFVPVSGDGIKSALPRILCALALAALLVVTAAKIPGFLSQTEQGYVFATEAGKTILLCLTCLFAAFSFVLCNVEAPAQSFAVSLISFALFNLLYSTAPEDPTYVFRDTASPIRSAKLTSVVLAVLFAIIGIKLLKKGYAMFGNKAVTVIYSIACALCILLVLAPHLPNFDILFLDEIVRQTVPSLVVPVAFLIYPHAVISPVGKLEARYKKHLEDQYGILPDGTPKKPRIDYYDFSDTQPTDRRPYNKK